MYTDKSQLEMEGRDETLGKMDTNASLTLAHDTASVDTTEWEK